MHTSLTGEIISAAMRVHSILGPGLLESPYRICLCHELTKRGLKAQTEVPVSINYDGIEINVGFRLDVLVENQVVVELKTATKLTAVDHAQPLSYLRLSRRRVGLLINMSSD